MEFRLWVGLWCLFFILILVVFNLSFLVKYITRFTEDCFATLVAIIFIIDAIKSTLSLRKPDEIEILTLANSFSNTTFTSMNNVSSSFYDSFDYKLYLANKDSDFFFSCLLFILTFAVCMGLKSFRNKPYLPTKVLTKN